MDRLTELKQRIYLGDFSAAPDLLAYAQKLERDLETVSAVVEKVVEDSASMKLDELRRLPWAAVSSTAVLMAREARAQTERVIS